MVVKDGLVDKYIMSASYDAKVIAKEAGINVQELLIIDDTDEVLDEGSLTSTSLTVEEDKLLMV